MNWKRFQARKPMAVFTWLLLIVLAGAGFVLQRDIPRELANLLCVIGSVVIGGYFGTSSYEACKAPKEEEPEDDG